MSIEREKQLAAEAAAEVVEDGMTVGLGTGSTVAYLLPALARSGLSLRCVATSPRTIDRLTLVNGSGYNLEVDVTGAGGDARSAARPAVRRGERQPGRRAGAGN